MVQEAKIVVSITVDPGHRNSRDLSFFGMFGFGCVKVAMILPMTLGASQNRIIIARGSTFGNFWIVEKWTITES